MYFHSKQSKVATEGENKFKSKTPIQEFAFPYEVNMVAKYLIQNSLF